MRPSASTGRAANDLCCDDHDPHWRRSTDRGSGPRNDRKLLDRHVLHPSSTLTHGLQFSPTEPPLAKAAVLHKLRASQIVWGSLSALWKTLTDMVEPIGVLFASLDGIAL